MRCPFCDAEKDSLKVIDSRACDGGRAIRRRRECLKCTKRFTTYEKIEEPVRVMVIKKDGRRLPWDRNKILRGLERACYKRPVPEEDLIRITEEVEEDIFRNHDREVQSSIIGQMLVDRLRRIDQVAYVRFASVYRQFKTLDELVTEAKAVIDAQRYEDPTQGVLFLDDPGTKTGVNGNGSKTSEGKAPAENGQASPMPIEVAISITAFAVLPCMYDLTLE